MSGLFGRRSKPKPVDPQVNRNLEEQERQAERDRISEGKKVQARIAARGGGSRSARSQLMTSGSGMMGRETAGSGLQTTLGRNPRSG
jgi:hypothetical protein